MKTIIITGPSGSGKTYLANKLGMDLQHTIIIGTDSFYRDNFLVKFISIFIYEIYDRLISIKRTEIKKLIVSIYNKENNITFKKYDFKRKKSSNYTLNDEHLSSCKFIILEGVFSHRLDLNYRKTINIICEDNKEICYQRRLKRDELERGRKRKEVKLKFNKSWYLYFKHLSSYLKNNTVHKMNSFNKIAYKNIIMNIKKT